MVEFGERMDLKGAGDAEISDDAQLSGSDTKTDGDALY